MYYPYDDWDDDSKASYDIYQQNLEDEYEYELECDIDYYDALEEL